MRCARDDKALPLYHPTHAAPQHFTMAQRSLLATQRRDEKLPFSGAAADEQQHCQAGVERQRRRGGRALLSLVLLLGLTLFVFPATIRSSPEGLDERIVRWIFSSSPSVAATAAEGSRVCPQVEPWTGPGEDAPHVEYPSAEQMGERLSGAVQVSLRRVRGGTQRKEKADSPARPHAHTPDRHERARR